MTPLAQRIVKQLTLPAKRRTFNDQCGLLYRMDDVHCFDVCEVFELAQTLSQQTMSAATANGGAVVLLPEQTFLPARKTWLEWSLRPEAGRAGVLLDSTENPALASLTFVNFTRNEFKTAPLIGKLSLRTGLGDTIPWPLGVTPRKELDDYARSVAFFLYSILAIINTPRIINRRQHLPHQGLERALRNKMGPQGKFPLHAWTEILLKVTPPKDMAGLPSTEAHLTGRKALHFCRAHLRMRRGCVEFVQGHWRGDASLGIKRSRYRLTNTSEAA